MTADIELLPLPEPWQCETRMCPRLYSDEQTTAYSRANMAPLIAEIEALRAEVEEARDGWHMANGTADLAMKHRDAAEAEVERLAEAFRELVALGHPRDPAIIAAKNALRDHDQEVGNG